MQTQEFWRQVVAPDVPDRDAAAMLRRVRTARRPRVRAWAAVAAAAVLLLAGTAILPRLAPPAEIAPVQTPAEPVTTPAEIAPTPAEVAPDQAIPTPADPAPPEAPQTPPAELPPDELHIHELGEESADAALSLERMRLLEEYRESWDLDQVLAYLGWDPRPAALPADLRPAFDDESRWVYAASAADDFLFDTFAFTWRENPDGEDYDPLERSVTVCASTQPIWHCGVLILEEDQMDSTVGGVPMRLGHRSMPYGPYTVVEDGPNRPAGYYHVFQAQFRKNGLYLELTTENLTQDEYVAVLRALAAQ